MSKEFFERIGAFFQEFGDRLSSRSGFKEPEEIAKIVDQQGGDRDIEDPIARCCPDPSWMAIAWQEHAKNVREDTPGQDPNILKYTRSH